MDKTVDTPFYQDEGISTHIMSPYLFDKSSLHLNLETMAACEPKLQEIKRNGTPSELRSPDLGFLKLGSPELEKMLMSLHNNVPGSSATNSLLNTNLNAPVNTEHTQEHVTYTRGFADALQDLHDRQGNGAKHSFIELPENSAANAAGDPFLGHNSAGGGSVAYIGAHPVRTTSDVNGFSSGLTRSDNSDYYTTTSTSYLTSRGSAVYPSYATSSNVTSGLSTLYNYPPENSYDTTSAYHEFEMEKSASLRYASYNTALAQQKAELPPVYKFDGQTSQLIAGDHSSLTPIDLEVQEVVKRERKKQRNRVASSKCRKRKLEREARLEVRVKDLKERNIELNAVANALKQQVCDLKQRVMEHVGEGCQIMLAHQSQM